MRGRKWPRFPVAKNDTRDWYSWLISSAERRKNVLFDPQFHLSVRLHKTIFISFIPFSFSFSFLIFLILFSFFFSSAFGKIASIRFWLGYPWIFDLDWEVEWRWEVRRDLKKPRVYFEDIHVAYKRQKAATVTKWKSNRVFQGGCLWKSFCCYSSCHEVRLTLRARAERDFSYQRLFV